MTEFPVISEASEKKMQVLWHFQSISVTKFSSPNRLLHASKERILELASAFNRVAADAYRNRCDDN
jgi:hypothetical protein